MARCRMPDVRWKHRSKNAALRTEGAQRPFDYASEEVAEGGSSARKAHLAVMTAAT
jgi:hypothetical protein